MRTPAQPVNPYRNTTTNKGRKLKGGGCVVRSNCELEFRDVDATKVENGGRNLQVGVYENESLNLPSPARNNRLPPTLRQCQYGLYVPAPPRFRWIPTSYSARIAGRISIVGGYGLKDDAFPLWFSRLRNRHQHGTITLAFSTSISSGYRMASSKTFLSPFCVKAEHSRYLQ
jgi:hypothetical protein